MKTTIPVPLPTLTEDEEKELMARQRRRNLILGWALFFMVILTIAITMILVAKYGFVPLKDQDLFRSS